MFQSSFRGFSSSRRRGQCLADVETVHVDADLQDLVVLGLRDARTSPGSRSRQGRFLRRLRSASRSRKKNSLSLMIGPPKVPP
jgi:hypothetical protein